MSLLNHCLACNRMCVSVDARIGNSWGVLSECCFAPVEYGDPGDEDDGWTLPEDDCEEDDTEYANDLPDLGGEG